MWPRLTVVARAPQDAPVNPIESGLARLRTPSPEDRWEEGWAEPQFARDLVAAVLSQPDGERILGFVVVAVARATLLSGARTKIWIN
jgi:hypothetical protein